MNPLILVGIQHSGKTTAAKLLAEQLNCAFFDTDTIIEECCGVSCRTLYAERGAEAFKTAELNACLFLKKYLQNAAAGCPPESASESTFKTQAVIASGGGICDNPRALSVLEQTGLCIYLHVSENTAFKRICTRAHITGSFPAYIEHHTPKNDEERKHIFRKIYLKRTGIYKRLAPLHIDAENIPPDKVCAAVLAAIREHGF